MSVTTPVGAADSSAREARRARRAPLIEAILDNLFAWTVIAAAVALLYLVWATLEILSLYVGDVPKVAP